MPQTPRHTRRARAGLPSPRYRGKYLPTIPAYRRCGRALRNILSRFARLFVYRQNDGGWRKRSTCRQRQNIITAYQQASAHVAIITCRRDEKVRVNSLPAGANLRAATARAAPRHCLLTYRATTFSFAGSTAFYSLRRGARDGSSDVALLAATLPPKHLKRPPPTTAAYLLYPLPHITTFASTIPALPQTYLPSGILQRLRFRRFAGGRRTRHTMPAHFCHAACLRMRQRRSMRTTWPALQAYLPDKTAWRRQQQRRSRRARPNKLLIIPTTFAVDTGIFYLPATGMAAGLALLKRRRSGNGGGVV